MSRIDASASGIRTQLPEAAQAVVRKKPTETKTLPSILQPSSFLPRPTLLTNRLVRYSKKYIIQSKTGSPVGVMKNQDPGNDQMLWFIHDSFFLPPLQS